MKCSGEMFKKIYFMYQILVSHGDIDLSIQKAKTKISQNENPKKNIMGFLIVHKI